MYSCIKLTLRLQISRENRWSESFGIVKSEEVEVSFKAEFEIEMLKKN